MISGGVARYSRAMSQENVEIVRRFWDARNAGDHEAACAELDPDVVVDLSRSRSPYRGVRHGHGGYRRLIREAGEGWGNIRFDAEEIIDLGEYVVVVSHLSVRGRSSGIEMRGSGANAFRVSGGRIVEFVLYQTKDEALDAVGLGG